MRLPFTFRQAATALALGGSVAMVAGTAYAVPKMIHILQAHRASLGAALAVATANDTAEDSRGLKVGESRADGTLYAGAGTLPNLRPGDDNQGKSFSLYITPVDTAAVPQRLNEAYCYGLDIHGHKDWRPASGFGRMGDEVWVLQQNRAVLGLNDNSVRCIRAVPRP